MNAVILIEDIIFCNSNAQLLRQQTHKTSINENFLFCESHNSIFTSGHINGKP